MRYYDSNGLRWVDRGMGFAAPQALGNCFTGTCAAALAPYGGAQCGPFAPAMPVPVVQPPPEGMGNCFTGTCANALAPYGGMQAGCGQDAAIRALVVVMLPRPPRGFLKRA